MPQNSLVRTVQLVGNLYEAALDDALWDDVIRKCTSAMNAHSGLLYCLDLQSAASSFEPRDGNFSALYGFEAKAVQDYADHYTYVNVWQRAEDLLCEGVAVTSSMLYPDALLPKTEFCDDWLRPLNLFYALGGVVSRKGNMASKVSLLRSRAAGAFDDDDLAIWQTVVPHMRRAIELRNRALHVNWTTSGAFAALDMLAQGVVLVSFKGELLFQNLKAQAMLRKQCGLFVDALGGLRAVTGASDTELQRLIREAIAAGSCSSAITSDGALRVAGQAGSLQLFVAPMPSRSDRFDLQTCAVAVFITDPTERPVALPDALVALYRMTPAEAQLTSALVSGENVATYAARREIAISTVRTHLAAATAKAGAKRQADLVRIVLTGPAVFQRGKFERSSGTHQSSAPGARLS